MLLVYLRKLLDKLASENIGSTFQHTLNDPSMPFFFFLSYMHKNHHHGKQVIRLWRGHVYIFHVFILVKLLLNSTHNIS